MTPQAKAFRLAQLKAELKSFEFEASRFAPDTAEHRHSMHRVEILRRDIERIESGTGV
jgi:hypothetical protein